ncbi:ABC transporter permease [Allosediminivita pacifica]|uniref:Peptide/nickel transport system permease protein n=1 Tax=Allosediminivita pacifica TaxID=1267769 RepID=A0A2T6AS86_9RHOB|nr:ABC transporter permease [Allosediminivita pacifica]PTX46682.1 peptide/nickel transport system permease protein [Allosediminivita pacifica]GGB16020.1 ABC transporter permease [Allosediminivita pacifica]
MTDFILRRLFQGFLVVFGVTTVVFVITRLAGDPVSLMLPLSASDEQRAAFAAQIGLDQPIWVQFLRFAGDVALLDFGDSLWQRRPAMEVVFERLPNTALLIAAGLGTAVVLSIPLGAIAALRPGGLADRLTTSISLLGLAMPQFWLGLMAIMIFSVTLKWLPTSGIGTPAHLVLPALTLAMTPLARFTMMVRAAMIDEMNTQYVKTARAKGLGLGRILRVHTLRNIMVPFLSISGWELITTLSGYTVVVETVFGWPGLGLTAVQAIQRGDLFLVQAIVFSIALMIVCIGILMDVLSKMIDPRIELN